MDPEDVYTSSGDCGTLLHLLLQGGSGSWENTEEGPLSASQNEVATLLLHELGTLAPPPADWDEFVPPVQERVVGPGWNPSLRYPLHLATIAGAEHALVAALLAAHPLAARLRDAAPRASELHQPCGYLPAHYALGAARSGRGPFASCRASSAQVQATLLAAYPLTEWPLVDLIRARPSALSDREHQSLNHALSPPLFSPLLFSSLLPCSLLSCSLLSSPVLSSPVLSCSLLSSHPIPPYRCH
jgi:hypothetical protein